MALKCMYMGCGKPAVWRPVLSVWPKQRYTGPTPIKLKPVYCKPCRDKVAAAGVNYYPADRVKAKHEALEIFDPKRVELKWVLIDSKAPRLK